MQSPQLAQLVYFSRNQLKDDDRGMLKLLREILSTSRAKNVHDGITGYLIFDREWFIQILEGDRAKITATYNRIKGDPRHGQVTHVETRDIKQRAFAQWSMGGAMRSLDQQEVYLRHGISGALEPAKLSGAKIVALAADLQAFEIAQKNLRLSA